VTFARSREHQFLQLTNFFTTTLRLAHGKMLAGKRTWIRGETENCVCKKIDDSGEANERVVGDAPRLSN
jgi:hypothetical protein